MHYHAPIQTLLLCCSEHFKEWLQNTVHIMLQLNHIVQKHRPNYYSLFGHETGLCIMCGGFLCSSDRRVGRSQSHWRWNQALLLKKGSGGRAVPLWTEFNIQWQKFMPATGSAGIKLWTSHNLSIQRRFFSLISILNVLTSLFCDSFRLISLYQDQNQFLPVSNNLRT